MADASTNGEIITRPAITGEKTTAQSPRFGGFGMGGFGIYGGIVPPPPGTYAMYRQMRSNPTVALVRAAATCAVKAADWKYKAEDGTPDEITAFIQSEMSRLKADIMRDAVRCLDYGFQSFEKVWAIDPDTGYYTYAKLKPLIPDYTEAIVDQYGNLTGARNGPVLLPIDNLCWIKYDAEGSDPYGRSRMENIRELAYTPWLHGMTKMRDYIAKNAGIIPQIIYPQGQGYGRDGLLQDNHLNARDVLANLQRGEGVGIPWEFPPWAEDMLKKGLDPSKLMAWQIGFLETRSGAGSEMLANLQHNEALMVRGWLRPERALLEGTAGTKAEAAVHSDVGTQVDDEILRDIVAQVNTQLVKPLLVTNFGPDSADAVCVEPASLIDDDRIFFREIVTAVLTDPGNVDLALTMLDFDQMLDEVGLPKGAEVVDPYNPENPRLPAPAPATNPQQLSRSARNLFAEVVRQRQLKALASNG